MAEVSPCTEPELPGLVAAVDAEFVLQKGRTRGLADRFPRLFVAANLGNIHVVRAEGRVVVAAASQQFTFVDQGRRWACASIGAVWTHPGHRGRGLASAVMRSLEAAHRAAGTEALTLWTSIHPFYEALGYRLDDLGLFGSAAGTSATCLLEPVPLSDETVSRLEALRRAQLDRYVERSRVDWTAVPLPAIRVDAVVSKDAYAMVGSAGDTGYVYEWVGSEAAFGELWAAIRGRHARVFINENGGRASSWLTRQGGVTFTPQRLAMWLPLTPRAEALAGRLFVPYLDRI